MTIRDLLPEIEAVEGKIVDFIAERNLDLSIDLGYVKHEKICSDGWPSNRKYNMITIYPNVKWTDGSTRPAYVSTWCAIKVEIDNKEATK